VLVSSSPHLSQKQATEAFMEITGLDPTASSLNEVMRQILIFHWLNIYFKNKTSSLLFHRGFTDFVF